METSVTVLLKKLRSGDKRVLDELFPLIYRELHSIAAGYLRRETPGLTLQPTSLIHEAYLRLMQYGHPEYASRAHFYGIAARVMRQILVDHARARHAAKREGAENIRFDDGQHFADVPSPLVLALHEALDRLAEVDEAKAQMVEMRFFGGMTAEEIGECRSIAPHNVRRQLRLANAWLHKELAA